MFEQGRQDRAAWEQWFNGLQGDVKTGAFFWASQRSLPNPQTCRQMNGDFYAGCTEAKTRLATSDTLRKTEPDYKAGWNAWTPTYTAAAPALTPPPASAPVYAPNPVYASPPSSTPMIPSVRYASPFSTPRCQDIGCLSGLLREDMTEAEVTSTFGYQPDMVSMKTCGQQSSHGSWQCKIYKYGALDVLFENIDGVWVVNSWF